MADRIRNVTALARRFGWRRSIAVFGLWTARQLFDFRKALIYTLDLDRIPALRGCDDIEWSYRSPPEVLHPRRRSPQVDVSSVVESRCFVGYVNNEQCYSSLVTTRGFSVPDRVRISFPGSTEAYVGDCTTDPAHRGRGIYPCGLVHLARRLRSEGKSRLYLFIESENLASIRSVQKAGFEPLAICTVWRVGRTSRRRWRVLESDAADLARKWEVRNVHSTPPD